MCKMAYKYCLLLLTCFILVNPTEALSFRNITRKIGRGLRKIGKDINKLTCKVSAKTNELSNTIRHVNDCK